jgi:hypothetical protein
MMREGRNIRSGIVVVDLSAEKRKERILAARREAAEQEDLEEKRRIHEADRFEKKYFMLEAARREERG